MVIHGQIVSELPSSSQRVTNPWKDLKLNIQDALTISRVATAENRDHSLGSLFTSVHAIGNKISNGLNPLINLKNNNLISNRPWISNSNAVSIS